MKNLLALAALCCLSLNANAVSAVSFPAQCNKALDATEIDCTGQKVGVGPNGIVVVGTGVCAVPTLPGGGTKGICSAPLQTPPAFPNSSVNEHLVGAKTNGGEGHAAGYYNGCASGYADALQTTPNTVDAGYGCCSSVTKVVLQDATVGNHFTYVGEACDPARGNGVPAANNVKDCCGGAIPLTCQTTGPTANTCCIPTGSAGPPMSTGYADPFPGWCCSGYASTGGLNNCLASPDGGNGGCTATGCPNGGYCDSHTGNCTPLPLGDPCAWKADGTAVQVGWPHGPPSIGFGGEPTANCAGGSPYGFCGYVSSGLSCSVNSTAVCCLMRDLQGVAPADGGPVANPCTQNTDCCTGVCNVANGQCGLARARQPCYDDGDCQNNGFGNCLWQNGGFCVY